VHSTVQLECERCNNGVCGLPSDAAHDLENE
jgi:hypothetical protein